MAAGNNACSARQNIRPLAWARSGCDNRAKSRTILGESDAGAYDTFDWPDNCCHRDVLFRIGSQCTEKKYDPGASDTEIKIGNIMPYSGPASAYGVIGKTEAAYFNKINAEGGINGRKINFISYDDGFSPPKAVEQARKLVESDEVLLIFQPLGTQSNSATQKYMNAKKVPQLFVATGATKWGDPQNFPWTMGWQPNYQSEGRIYAKYILKNYPNGKIAALWQNDDAGKDQMKECAMALATRPV